MVLAARPTLAEVPLADLSFDEQGTVRLAELVELPCPRRALVTILDEEPAVPTLETALLSDRGACGGLEPARGGCRVGTSVKGSVVLVPFPFSDLSQAKLRPAVVMADAGRNALC
jgi:hypothetical protein